MTRSFRDRTASCSQRLARLQRRRRPIFEPLEPRAMLASLAVAANSAIFDTTSAAPHAEASNLIAELASQGHTVTTFTNLSAAGIAAALAGKDAVVIPEQEFGSLIGALATDAKNVLAQFVASGHGMIVLGSASARAEALLNGLFGFSLVAAADPTAGVSFLDDVDSVGTAFATGPVGVLNFVSQVRAFDATNPASFPAGSRLVYKFGSARTVGLFPHGQGQVVYFGHDFDDPAGQPAAASWRTVLSLAVAQVAVAPPTTSVELVGGDLVIADLGSHNDAFTLSADAQQWTITIGSGLFSASAPMAGVSVGQKTIVIDKSAAATFTGRFVFAGGGGNDVLSVELDDLGRDVHFDGGEAAGDHDTLRLSSAQMLSSLTSVPDSSGGGAIDIGASGHITYTGLEPVDLTGIVVAELHFVLPPAATAELNDHLAPTDGFSQLAFGGTGPEDQFFRHPTQRLAIHTSGGSLVTLRPLDPTVSIPELLLDGAASDLFQMGATSGIRSETSLTLVGATLDLNGQSPSIHGLSGNGDFVNSAATHSVLSVGGAIEPGVPGDPLASLGGYDEVWRPGSRFHVELGGVIAGAQHDQRRIASGLALAGAALDVSLASGFTLSQQQSQSFTIIDNRGGAAVDGAFSALPEGAAVNVPGSAVPLFITYQGGDGNDVVLYSLVDSSQILGTDGDDRLVLRRQAGEPDSELEYSLNGAPFAALADLDSLSIDMRGGSDLVILDFVYGDPAPPQGLSIDGGDPSAAPGDRLVLLGAFSATQATYRPSASGRQGTIELAGVSDGLIELVGLEAIDATALAQVTLATPGPDDLDIMDGTDAGDGLHAALRIVGTSGGAPLVPLHVWAVGSLVIDTAAGGGADQVAVVSAAGAHGVGNLQIKTGGESSDRVVVGATNIAGNLTIDSGVVLIGGAVTAGGAIDVASHGLLRVDAPLVAHSSVTLTTTDHAGLDADLAIEAAVTSLTAGVALHSADNVIVRGALSAATTIHIAIDTADTDPGEGNTLFVQAALSAPSGTTASGNGDADRFEIEPQEGSSLLILGQLPASSPASGASGNAIGGNVPGDQLVLDMTSTGAGSPTLGPVIVDTLGGRATAQNTRPIVYRGFEGVELFDGGSLTSVRQGDLYVRGTDADERITISDDGQIHPSLRVTVGSRSFPEDAVYFGPYLRGRTVVVFGRGGRDSISMGSVPLVAEFYGQGGDDYLVGAAFGDLLVGGAGSDRLQGGSLGGGDELWGDDYDPLHRLGEWSRLTNREFWSQLVSPTDGNDSLTTTGGDDQLYGQGGDDTIGAGGGADYASGGGGNDRIGGGDGNDRLFGNAGHDVLAGDGGHDLLSGGDGDDLLLGRLGNDVLIGGDGADELNGNEGNDLLLAGMVEILSPVAGESATNADSAAAGDAADVALLALLLEWSTLAKASSISHLDDGDLDWLYGHSGSDLFGGDGSSSDYDFVAGVDGVV